MSRRRKVPVYVDLGVDYDPAFDCHHATVYLMPVEDTPPGRKTFEAEFRASGRTKQDAVANVLLVIQQFCGGGVADRIRGPVGRILWRQENDIEEKALIPLRVVEER